MFENIALNSPGRLVVLEPLHEEHGPGPRAAAQDMDWSFMPVDPSAGDALFNAGSKTRSPTRRPASTSRSRSWRLGRRAPLGSTRYLSLRPEHRGLEIGWTWLTRSAWSTGANVEAKLLSSSTPSSVWAACASSSRPMR